MKFLIVEDEIRIREGIRRLLPKLDPENEIAGEAENGERGLALIQKLRPDVIITDVSKISPAPGCDGVFVKTNQSG